MTVLETQELYLLEYLNQIDKDKTASIFDVEKYVADKKWTKNEAKNIMASFYDNGFFKELNSDNLHPYNRQYALNEKGITYYNILKNKKLKEDAEIKTIISKKNIWDKDWFRRIFFPLLVVFIAWLSKMGYDKWQKLNQSPDTTPTSTTKKK